jgi:hypothetical protein
LKYAAENRTKACFDDVYTAPTPNAYIATMARSGYEIGEQARPYIIAAAELLRKHIGGPCPVRMLDIGCSYGMGAAFVKYNCSFDEMVTFFSTHPPQDYHSACEGVRNWLKARPTPYDIRCVGLDKSGPAIRFAMKAGLLDNGIARDFENPEMSPNSEECVLFRSANLLISTGAIGYITDRTMSHVVRHLGKDHPSEIGPFALLTILRMFDATPINHVFETYGFRFEKVQGAMLPQRRFTDNNEKKMVLKILHEKGIDTSGWEDRGMQFAELFVGAKPDHFHELLEKMNEVRRTRVIRRPDAA